MSLLSKVSRILINWSPFWPKSPELVLAGVPQALPLQNVNEERFEDSIMWNTPKRRKTIERRTFARYGSLTWGNVKYQRKNKKIRVDYNTGEFFELGKLAPTTYKKIMEETKEIQQKMKDSFQRQFTPQNKEIVVVYEDEEKREEDQDKIPVEMKKPRPPFFSPNLMQKARVSQESQSTTTVRPTGLS